jgi:hypothetical protein
MRQISGALHPVLEVGEASNEVILCDFYPVPSDLRQPKNSRGNCCRDRYVESHICLSFCGITNVHSKDVIALLHHDEAPSVSKGQLRDIRPASPAPPAPVIVGQRASPKLSSQEHLIRKSGSQAVGA